MANYELYMWDATPEEQGRIQFLLNLFANVRLERYNFEMQWEEAASVIWPEYRSTFVWQSRRAPGSKQTQFQVDSSGAIAAGQFGAVVESMTMPATMQWTPLTASNPDVMKDRNARLWFEEVSRILYRERYAPEANFQMQNQKNCKSLGVFGNMPMFVEEWMAPHIRGHRGLAYRAPSVGEIYILEGFQGRVEGFVRAFRMTAQQAAQKWGYDKLPAILCQAIEKATQFRYEFLHFVLPRTDWNPYEWLTPKGKPYASIYMSVEGHCILEEGGYRTFPLAYARYGVAPDEVYGRGPAQQVLPSFKTNNAAARDFLVASHKAANPAYLIGDEGLFDFKAHAGTYNHGAMFIDGKAQVDIVPSGNPVAAEKVIEREDRFIQSAFLIDLFQLLYNDIRSGRSSQRSPREVVEYLAERGVFLAPTLGSLNGQYKGPLAYRELDVLSSLRMLPPMPPVLREAEGEFDIKWDSPADRAADAQEVAGAMQTVEFAHGVVQATGDISIMDIFDFDELIPGVGKSRMMPERYFASMEARRAKAKQRAEAAAREQQAKEMPARAAIIKAQAVAAKAQAGQNIGGTLSGVPAEQMPQIPPGGY